MTIVELIPQLPPDLPPATPQRDGLRWELSPSRWVHVQHAGRGLRASFAAGDDYGVVYVTRPWLIVAWVRALYAPGSPVSALVP